MSNALSPALAPLAYRDFRFYWCARLMGMLAQNMMVVVIGWQAYELARSHYGLSINAASFVLGLIGLAQFTPMFILSPFAGLLADSFERRRIAQIAWGLDTLAALGLCVATYTGVLALSLLFIVAIVHGVVRTFTGPALASLAPNLVPRDVFPRAVAINSISVQLASIGGPVLGGFIYALAPALPYGLSFILLAAASLSLHTLSFIPQEKSQSDESPFVKIRQGFRYVWGHKMLLGCISLDLFAVLLGGATAMLPAFARDILHVGASGLGLMRAAPGVGGALIAFILVRHPIKESVGVKMLVAVGIYGLATVIFGLSHWLVLSLAMLVIIGGADMVSVFIRNTLNALYTPDDMRGRVSAISGLFISASNELGEAESGLLAAAIGPVAAVVAGGIGAIAITAAWFKLFPDIPNTRNFTPPDHKQ